MDGAGFAAGFVLSFPTEKEFVEALVHQTFMEQSMELRKAKLKHIYKVAKQQEKKS